jgi:sterol desaturase/sphingolipid hydroxylase (fatty acid hydroxylase superfamily)
MKFEKIHNKGEAQIFKSPVLEFFIWGMYTPLMIWSLYHAGAAIGFGGGRIALTFFGGVAFWTLFEYIMHRFAFHYDAETEKSRRFIYVMHGNHHEYPRDKNRLFMPPLPSILISTTLFGICYLIMGVHAFMFMPGFIFGYLLYGSMHYAIHAWNPPFKWMKGLWRNHHLHHYKDDHKGFGVSSTIWDHVFGTMQEK